MFRESSVLLDFNFFYSFTFTHKRIDEVSRMIDGLGKCNQIYNAVLDKLITFQELDGGIGILFCLFVN